ncbi:MAG: hypothetical protein ACLRJV_16120 [Eubacteriales bacterium]
MPIERITADDLRDMEHQEGLVLQGCGGEAQEWLDGINDLLTQDGILQNGSRFETVKVFQHDGLNNLLFPFGTSGGYGEAGDVAFQTHASNHMAVRLCSNGLGGLLAPAGRTPPFCFAGAGRQHLPSDGYCRQSLAEGMAAEASRPASWAERATATRKHWNHQRICGTGCLRPAKIERKEGEA